MLAWLLVVGCVKGNYRTIPVNPDGSPADGPVDAQAQGIANAVRRQSPQLKYCFEAAVGRREDVAGRVEMAWTIGGGHAEAVAISSNETGDDLLAECIADNIRGWTFDPAATGEVEWPFVVKQRP